MRKLCRASPGRIGCFTAAREIACTRVSHCQMELSVKNLGVTGRLTGAAATVAGTAAQPGLLASLVAEQIFCATHQSTAP
jgi:hypothetical protein